MTVGAALLVGAVETSEILDENTNTQIRELATLRDAHETRLRHLLRQQANLGRSAPVEIGIEIEAIQASVARIAGDIGLLQIGASQRAQQAARVGATKDLRDISKQIAEGDMANLHGIHSLVALILQSQDSDQAKREQRQRITITFYAVITGLVLVDLVLRLVARKRGASMA